MNWNLREGIVQALKANATVNSLVANIWSSFAPTETAKDSVWIVMTKISGSEEGCMTGDNGLTHPTFQFTVGGTDKVGVDTVQQALIDMNCSEFTYVGGSPSAGHVLTFFHRGDRDGWDERARVYRPSVDLEIWANK